MAQGAGLFSKIGGYVMGAGMGMKGTQASMIGGARVAQQAGYNAGQLAQHGWNAAGSTGRGAMMGAAAGGAWGAMSEDTSVLGGMAMGAGLGAGAGRYGGAGMRMAGRANKLMANTTGGFAKGKVQAGAFGLGAFGKMRQDFRGAANWGAGRVAKGKEAWSAAKARATSAPAGATVASNAAVNPVASSHSMNNGSIYDRVAGMKGMNNAQKGRTVRRAERAASRQDAGDAARYNKWQRSNYYAGAPQRQSAKMEQRLANMHGQRMGLTGMAGLMSL